MSWSRRGFLLALPAVAISGLGAGCGFTPAFAPGGAGSELFGATAYDVPDTPEGYRLRARLQERLGQAGADAPYSLTATLTLIPREAALSPGGEVVRRALRGEAPWALSGPMGELASGTVSSFVAWPSSGSTVAVRAAEDDARGRLAVQLADLIVTEALGAVAGAGG
ncbi:LPS assembly lipoprotein LptE [Pseudoroseicyclus sp. H15]